MAPYDWGPTIVLCTSFLLSVLFALALVNVKRIKEEADRGWVGLHDYFARQTGLKYRNFQRISVVALVIAYFAVVRHIYNLSPQNNAVIVGALLGAFPTFAAVLNELASKPFVVLDEVRVVKYPKKWYSFGNRVKSIEGENSLCLHANLVNEGREVAEDCEVRIASSKVDRLSYPTRWSDGNELSIDLHPGEQQQVDLLWVDSRSHSVSTGEPFKSGSERDFPPGNYDRVNRVELDRSSQSFEVEIDSANMRMMSEKLSLDGNQEIDVPEDISDTAEEWEVIRSMKSGAGHYAVLYDDVGIERLVVPAGLNLSYLRQLDDFKPEKIVGKKAKSYEEALNDRYEIIRD